MMNNDKCTVKEYENAVHAYEAVERLRDQGFNKDNMYFFAHSERLTDKLAEMTDTSTVGMQEQGFMDSVTTFFQKRGDEIRTQLQNLGLSQTEAEDYEKTLDEGKVLLVVKNDGNDVNRFM